MTVPISNPNPPGYIDETSLNPGNFGKPYILNRVFDLLVLMIDVLQRTAAAQANRLNFLTQWQKAYTDELNQIHAFVSGNGDQKGTIASAGLDGKLGNNYTISFSGIVFDATGNPGSYTDSNGFIGSRGNESLIYSGTHVINFEPTATQLRQERYYRDGSSLHYLSATADTVKGAISDDTTVAVNARQALTTANATYTQQIQGNLNVISNDAKALQANVNQTNDAVQAQADMATSILQQLATILTAIFQ